MSITDLHSAAVAAIGEGRVDEGREQLLELVRGRLDIEHVNDLAVASQMAGRLDEAQALLEAARAVVGEHPDITENLALLAECAASVPAPGARGRRRRQRPNDVGARIPGHAQPRHDGRALHALRVRDEPSRRPGRARPRLWHRLRLRDAHLERAPRPRVRHLAARATAAAHVARRGGTQLRPRPVQRPAPARHRRDDVRSDRAPARRAGRTADRLGRGRHDRRLVPEPGLPRFAHEPVARERLDAGAVRAGAVPRRRRPLRGDRVRALPAAARRHHAASGSRPGRVILGRGRPRPRSPA